MLFEYIAIASGMCIGLFVRYLLRWRWTPKETVSKVFDYDIPVHELLQSAAFSQFAYDNVEHLSELQRRSLERHRTRDFSDDEAGLMQDIAIPADMSEVVFIDAVNRGAEVYVWIHNSVAYVVFRGTNDPKDVLADLDFRLIDISWSGYEHVNKADDENCDVEVDHEFLAGAGQGAMVHRGFFLEFQAVRGQIYELLKAREADFIELVCTGHSLGGAMATLAAFVFAEVFKDKLVHCHTFGTPRVGNRRFCELFLQRVRAENHWRVFERDDPVVMFPISCRFVHVPVNGLRLGANVKFDVLQRDVAWYMRLVDLLVNIDIWRPVRAHLTNRYVLPLRAMNQALETAGQSGGKRLSLAAAEFLQRLERQRLHTT